jgi:hypothetical protein
MSRSWRPWPRRLAPLVVFLAIAEPARAETVTDWMFTRLVSTCWSCDTLNDITDMGLELAGQAFTALAGEVASLLGLLMGLWLLFLAGRMFLPFGPEGQVGSLWNEGAKKLLRFAVVLAFLQGSAPFWDYIFIPLMSASMGGASKLVLLSDPFEAERGAPEAIPQQTVNYCGDTAGGSGLSGAKAVMHQMDCPLAKIQSQFAKGMLVGVAIIAGGGRPNDTSASGIVDVVWQSLNSVAKMINALVCGLALILVYFFGFLIFPFVLIDVVMRVTVTTVFAPVAIAASLFRPTKRLADKALWNLAQAGLNLVFAAIAAGIAKACLAATFANLPVLSGHKLASWRDLVAALEDPSQGVTISLFDSSFYALLGVGIILLFMLRQASHMAAEFTGASGGDFSGAARGTAAMVGTAAYSAGALAQKVVRAMR